MASCNGDGKCLSQCMCECYNEDTGEYYDECTCKHKEHTGGYCPSNCCIAIDCRNYKYCNEKRPEWVLSINNGMCFNCAVQMGNHTLTTQIEECCICYESAIMLVLKCNHKVCNDCWYKITKSWIDNKIDYAPLCPLCRNLNSWDYYNGPATE